MYGHRVSYIQITIYRWGVVNVFIPITLQHGIITTIRPMNENTIRGLSGVIDKRQFMSWINSNLSSLFWLCLCKYGWKGDVLDYFS